MYITAGAFIAGLTFFAISWQWSNARPSEKEDAIEEAKSAATTIVSLLLVLVLGVALIALVPAMIFGLPWLLGQAQPATRDVIRSILAGAGFAMAAAWAFSYVRGLVRKRAAIRRQT